MDPYNNSISEGQRIKTLAQLAEQMRNQHASHQAIVTKLKMVNTQQCTPPLPEEVVVKIAKNPGRYKTEMDELEKLEPASSTRRDKVGLLLSEVEAQQVRWLWSGRIPLGKLAILDGDPALGKSLLTLDIAARVTTGRPMPDGTPTEQGGVVLVAPEDGAGDTLKPRLEAAKGDPAQVLLLNTVEHKGLETDEVYERTFTIPGDLVVLEEAIHRVKAVLVILDPLMAVLGPDINSFRDQDVRRALTPLAQLAERMGCAVVIVRHLNKGNSENKLYRGGGSIGIIASARVGLMVTLDPDDENKRVLFTVKNNLSKWANSYTYQVVENEDGVPYIQWLEESDRPALTLPGGAANLSYERQIIVKMLKDSIDPLTPKEIAERMKQDYKKILLTLSRMQKAGEIVRPYRGYYTTPYHPSISRKGTDKNTDTYDTSNTNDITDTNDTKPIQNITSKVSKVSLVSEISQNETTSQREPATRIPAEVSRRIPKPIANCDYEKFHWMYWHPCEGEVVEIVCPICDQVARQSSKLSPKRRALYDVMNYYRPLEGEQRSAWIERIGPIFTVAM
jgi:archaellum biogenesis ATPase FlaH